MSPTPSRPQRRRARPVVRWSPWEMALLLVSVVMIASPLLAAGWAIISPTVAPAATLQRDDPPPTECPDGPCAPPTVTVPPTATPTATMPPTSTPSVTNTPLPTPTQAPNICDPTGYNPCTPCDSTGYGVSDPCETVTPAPTARPVVTPAPTNTPAPTTPPSTPAPTSPPSTPRPSSGLRVTKEAIGLNGQSIALVNPGDEYLYLIRVEHQVSPAVPVLLEDAFDAGIDAVALVNVENGTCQLSTRVLSCTMSPAQDAVASALVRVRVSAAGGTHIPNTARATVPGTGESTSGSAGTVQVAPSKPVVVPTSAPVTPPTSAPVTPPTSVPVTPPTSVPTPPPPPEVEPEPPAPEPTPEPAPTDAPPAPTDAPPMPTDMPPTPEPTATPRPTDQPQPTATSAPVRRQAAAASTPVPTSTPAPQPTRPPAPTPTPGPTQPPVTTPEPEKPSLRFNLASDWGQVFVGDELTFVITLQNAGSDVGGSSPMVEPARPVKLGARLDAPPIHDLVISDELDPRFEIIEATANGLTVQTEGQKVEARRGTLAGGEIVTLTIKVRAGAADSDGTMVSNQARLTYRDESQALFSNVVDVRIMPQALPTATPQPTAEPTPTTEPILAAGAEPVIAPPEELGESLPQTSGGAPLAGVVLLGLTMLLHSVRVHRARIRI